MAGQTLVGVEIFATGVHHAAKGGRVEIDEQDLDEMVNSFNDLKDFGGFKPVLKLGHAETQKFFGNTSGAPNLGFVENVRRVGGTIIADFTNVPELLFDLIKDGRYNQVSVEMMRTVDVVGRQFRNVLTAVALLGAEMPAVKGLSELMKALMADAELNKVVCSNLTGDRIELSREADMPEGVTYTAEQHEAVVAKAVQEAVASATATFTEQLEAGKAELTKVTAERDGLRTALHTFKTDQVADQVKAMVDGAIEANQILPKQRDTLLEMGATMATVAKFGADEKSGLEGFGDYLKALPKVVETGEKGFADKADNPTDQKFTSEGDRVDALVRRHMAENKSEDYAASYAHVLKTLSPAEMAAYAGAN